MKTILTLILFVLLYSVQAQSIDILRDWSPSDDFIGPYMDRMANPPPPQSVTLADIDGLIRNETRRLRGLGVEDAYEKAKLNIVYAYTKRGCWKPFKKE